MKFKEPSIDLAPAIWRENMARSREAPSCPPNEERGGYRVHPAPTPVPLNAEIENKIEEGTKSQNLKLLRRGKAISKLFK